MSPARRPMRADARRNYERLIIEAKAAFTERGAEASLEEIARRAGVGIGTLYRHFPTRLDLQEAVYRDDVQTLCARAGRLAEELPPFRALSTWLSDFVDHLAVKRGMARVLLETYGKDSELFRSSHEDLRAAGNLLLRRAQEAGDVRRDIALNDVLRLGNAVALAVEQMPANPGNKHGMLRLMLDGLRYQPRDDEGAFAEGT